MTESFAALLDESLSTLDMQPGSIVSGVVLDVDKDWVTVHVGLKSEGVVSLDEFRNNEGEVSIVVGDEVEVALEAVEDGYGETRISREKARKISTWKMLEDALESGEFVTGKIHNRVKGGFAVEVEVVKAFLPGSLVDVRPLKEAPDIENTVQEFKVIKLDYKRNNVVLSRKAVLEKNNSAVKVELLKNLEEGQIVKGIVKNITDYGAFVDLGGIDGLLHVTDISWKRISSPEEIISIGETIKVLITKVSAENMRISLGMKQLQNDPWVEAQAKYTVGERYKGRVTNIADYGAFVELEGGIEGLVHVSEMSWVSKIQNPNKYVTQNQEVEVQVLEIDIEKKRLSLGLKQTLDNPWESFAQNNPIGTKLKGKIQNITDFGLFVQVSDELDGLVHMSDVDWRKSGPEAIKDFEVGQEIDAIIIDIEPIKERISLGIKQLDGDPMDSIDNIKKGTVVTCTVVQTQAGGIDVEIGDKIPAFIRRSDLSKDKSEQNPERFEVGRKVDAKVTSYDAKSRKISLSIKALEISDEKQAIEQYGSKDSGASLGDILGEALDKSSSSEDEDAKNND